jgi:hypothetical protein
MEDKAKFVKIVKWAGLMALIAIPVVVYMKSRKAAQRSEAPENEESDIYATEQED